MCLPLPVFQHVSLRLSLGVSLALSLSPTFAVCPSVSVSWFESVSVSLTLALSSLSLSRSPCLGPSPEARQVWLVLSFALFLPLPPHSFSLSEDQWQRRPSLPAEPQKLPALRPAMVCLGVPYCALFTYVYLIQEASFVSPWLVFTRS